MTEHDQKKVKSLKSDSQWLKDYGFLPFVITLVGAMVATPITLVVFVDSLAIISNYPSNPTITNGTSATFTLSSSEGIGLALLSAGLAAVVFLLVKPNVNKETAQAANDKTKPKGRQTAEIIGVFLIASAMGFALFSLLIPFMNVVATGERFFPSTPVGNFSEWLIKMVALISLTIGSTCLAMSLTFGPFVFFADWLSTYLKNNRSKKVKPH